MSFLIPRGQCAGLHGTVFYAASRFSFFAPREDDIMMIQPSPRTMGIPAYVKYLMAMTFIYCTLVFVIEAFSDFSIHGNSFVRIVSSGGLTFIIPYALSSISVGPYRRS